MIAALYVESGGCYFGLDGVDPWDVVRDARFYTGPHAVIAHPPCQRWGRYWSGGPSATFRRAKGDDAGCFANAIMSVRRFGGVLEHPEASYAYEAFGLRKPPRSGGWVRADEFGGWTCCVEQGHYGHRARKATWLYVNGLEFKDLPQLIWGPAEGKERMDEGYHSTEERTRERAAGIKPRPRLSAEERVATPIPFRDLLIDIANKIEATQ
jgi:hypothetical protein